MTYAGRITVEDASGARFQLHEFRGVFLFGKRRFVLESGERVKRIDFDTYRNKSTGAVLTRVSS